MPRKTYWVYILTNRSGTLYIGMTSNLAARVYQHRQGTGSRFTSRYRVGRLVYAEPYRYVWDAIARERELKSWSRRKKVALINEHNPSWQDLAEELLF